jgi:hypothetical protein
MRSCYNNYEQKEWLCSNYDPKARTTTFAPITLRNARRHHRRRALSAVLKGEATANDASRLSDKEKRLEEYSYQSQLTQSPVDRYDCALERFYA